MAARQLPRNLAARPVLVHARFESTAPPPKYPSKADGKRAATKLQDWEAPVITYEDLKPRTISPKPNGYIIDVREPDEVAQGMIASAVNVPLTVLDKALLMKDAEFQEKFGFKKPNKNQEVIFYCRSGMRSSTASDLAERAGYQNVLNYKGSWIDWVEREVKKD
ncbi:endoplasmic reticulum protein [Hymenopellis radicata]|nr:endoplasmic reticulum protein [Hymenopellis radicata]